jgi:hypothetical protein
VGSHSFAAVYGGDAGFTGSTSAATPYTVSKAATSITAKPVLATLPDLVAILKTGSGAPLAGETVTFTTTSLLGLTFTVCHATTDATGTATCTGGGLSGLFDLGLSYTATFAGDADYQGSSAKGQLL